MSERLTVVVPTRNRPQELQTLLANLAAQSRQPDHVVVVDGSDEPIRPDIERIVAASPLRCTLKQHWPPSAAAQRNAGLAVALSQADLIAFLDDDLTLDPEALKNACRAIAECGPEFIGFGFNPVDGDAQRGHGALKAMRITEAMGLYSTRPGAVSKSGWHTRQVHVDRPTEVEWLLSGAVIWRASAVQNICFDEFFVQYSYLEDLEFGLQARRHGRFLLLPDATFLHVPASGGRKSRFWFGRIEVRNRHYIVCKHGFSLWRFWLGMTIRSTMTLGRGITRDRDELGRFGGNLYEAFGYLFRSGRTQAKIL